MVVKPTHPFDERRKWVQRRQEARQEEKRRLRVVFCAMIAACLRWIGGWGLEGKTAERRAEVGRVYVQAYDCGL